MRASRKGEQGQDTGERDAYGRPVTATAAWFARRYKISSSTFDRWLKPEIVPITGSISNPEPQDSPPEPVTASEQPEFNAEPGEYRNCSDGGTG